VLVPLAILVWLGVRLDVAERATRADLIDRVIVSELEAHSVVVSSVVSQWERDLLADLEQAPIDPSALRERLLESTRVSQYFVVDAQRMLRFPTYDDSITPAEEEALLRTRDIWLNRELTTQSAPEQQNALPSNRFAGKGGVMNIAPSQRTSGWYVWHWGGDIHLIYWLQRADGFIVVAELNRPRLTADIIAALPHTDDGAEVHQVNLEHWALGSSPTYTLPPKRLELRNTRGDALYVWDNDVASNEVRALVSLPLGYPLGMWSLAYCVDPQASINGEEPGFWYRLSTRIGALALALVGIAIYFYRESAREMREAAQRVSFVNQVSHELKTPLTNIRMYAELLEQNLDSDDEQSKRHVGVLVSESQRLSRLIGNILTFGRKERQTLKLRPAPGSVDACVASVLSQFKPALEARGIEVASRLDANRTVMIDADAIGQIVGNLVSNVEKYASAGKRLYVESKQDGDSVRVTVSDEGPGVPEKDRKRVFEPFYRVSDKLTDGVAGTGIGLTIARELARLHGGDLALVPSEHGAKFVVTLHCPPAGVAT